MNSAANGVCGLLGLLLVAAQGCATNRAPEPPTYHLLDPAPLTNHDASTAPLTFAIAVGPVTLPSYLDQPQLILRSAADQLKLSRRNRWAVPLSTAIPNVLRAHLEGGLSGISTSSFPASDGRLFDYRIAIEIQRLDGQLGEAVTLRASWQAFDRHNQPNADVGGKLTVIEPLTDRDLSSLVRAHERALGKLARSIAGQFKR